MSCVKVEAGVEAEEITYMPLGERQHCIIHPKTTQLVFFKDYLPYFQSAVTTVEKVLPFKIIFTLIFYLSQDSPIVHVWQRPELVSHKIGEGRLNGIKCMRFLMHKNE